MAKTRFTGKEDRARCDIVVAMKRVKWAKVAEELRGAGFPERTPKSVRNRHLRVRQAAIRKTESKNMCRTCGLPQRGHVCGGVTA